MFAGAVLTLVGGVGLTVDYLGMTDSAANLQSAVDGAALAAALASNKDQEAIKLSAEELFGPLRAQGQNVTTEYVFKSDSIIVKAKTVYEPRIMGILGFGARTLSVKAAVPLGTGSGLDIALVLDITDSMDENNKLQEMQGAVNGFLNQFQTDDADIRVSIVPFSQYVNVGVENINQPWLDNSQEGSTFPPSVQEVYVTESCPVDTVPDTFTRVRDGVATVENFNRCPVSRESTQVGSNIIEPVKVWDGCVGSRAGNLSVQSDYSGTPFPAVYDDGNAVRTPYRGTDYACPTDSVLPLTDNIPSAQTLVGSLDTRGTTYMPSGLAWGWRTLDDDTPLGRPIDGDERRKVIILMTDGFNTVSRRGPDPDVDNDGRYHHGEFNQDSGVTDEANIETATLCTNIESDGIQIFTIAYELPNSGDADTTRALLSNCAAADSFFDASNASQLNAAFESIKNNLSDIRLIN